MYNNRKLMSAAMKLPKVLVYSEHGKEYVPESATVRSIGYDIRCPKKMELDEGVTYIIDTGLILDGTETLEDWGYMIHPRGGSFKKGIQFANTTGVVEPDYCGPEDTLKLMIKINRVIFEDGSNLHQTLNTYYPHVKQDKISNRKPKGTYRCDPLTSGQIMYTSVIIEEGERIAQLVFQPILKPELIWKGSLEEHPGGKSRGGFGSSGQIEFIKK
jgi:dUTPase